MDPSRIKVTDRRLFTEEGELRADLEGLDDTPEEPTGRPVAPSPAAPASPTAPAASATSPPAAERDDSAYGAGQGAAGPQFLDLVDLLCQQIAMALGDPRLGADAPPPDPRVARIYIDLLGVLQEKTRGNLSEEEAAVLEELVYRFRMLYVEQQRR
jgi:hypothetical protein